MNFEWPLEVKSILMQKRGDNVAGNRVINEVSLMYSLDQEFWHPYDDGKTIKTGQKSKTTFNNVQKMNLKPFVARSVKMIIKAKYATHPNRGIRFDYVVSDHSG